MEGYFRPKYDIGKNYGMELRTLNQYPKVIQTRVIIQTKIMRIYYYNLNK